MTSATLRTSILAFALLAGGEGTAAVQQDCAKPNRLIDSASPYLLQHACNPVDWLPWGPEAIERARRENKPIFVSVGYSTCYWCHVANRTLYENPAIAALMNAHFINIKIDREQRPDLDRLFMAATTILAGSGGWPNNLFLTPALEPFFAGSYFPPTDDEFGRPGFMTLLGRIHDDWQNHRERLEERGRRAAGLLRERSRPEPAAVAPEQWRAKARDAIASRLDRKHGGLITRNGARFPQPALLDYLFAEQAARPDAELAGAVTQALDAMAAGGIRDHVGGGFHRYAVEPSWSVPHFEKMLYDNAQLLSLYAQAWRNGGKPAWRDVALGIAAHLARDMQAAEGGFYTAVDSGVGAHEGQPYLWRRGEIEAVLGAADTARLFERYELRPVATREVDDPLAEQAGVLRLRRLASASGTVERALLARLLAARMKRPQPQRDEKQVVALNGLAITALASSGRALRVPAQVELARRAAERIWLLAWDGPRKRLMHGLFRGRPQGEGLLEDYAHLARGFLALHEAGAGAHWRSRARVVIDAALERFRRPDGRLAASHETLLLPFPLDDAEDYAYPSGTSAAIDVLLRLGDARLAQAAAQALKAGAGQIAAAPAAWPALLATLVRHEAAARAALSRASTSAPAGALGPRPHYDSAAHVEARAALRQHAGATVLELTVQVQRGWHINANPASLDFLVPTRLLVEGAVPRRIVYPDGIPFRPRFAPEAISVYQGEVAILAEFASGSTDRLRARLSLQSCNETACLAPSVVPVWPAIPDR